MPRLLVLLLATLLVLGCSEDDLVGEGAGIVAVPSFVDFGTVLVGGFAQREVDLHNRSRRAVTVDLPSGEQGFVVDPGEIELPPGGRASVWVRFVPAVAGAQEQHVASVDLRLRGDAATPVIDAPGEVDFGPTRVGNTERRRVHIRNGSRVAIRIEPQLGGRDAASFEAPRPVELAPGGEAEIEVAFHPNAAGVHRAALELAPCGSCRSSPVALLGDGLREDVSYSPSSIDFGLAMLSARLERTVRIRNHGTRPAPIADVRLVGSSAFHVVAPPRGTAVPPGSEIELAVRYQPRVLGRETATLRMQVDTSVIELPLSGTCVDGQLAATPARLDLGTARIGERLTGRVLLAGSPDVLITRVQPEDESDFSARAARMLPAQLEDQGLGVEVSVATSRPGLFRTELVVATDRAGLTLQIPVQAAFVRAEPCSVEVRPTVLRFGLVAAGSQAVRKVVLRNTGVTSCDVFAVQIVPQGNFSLPGDPSPFITVPPGEQTAITVAYDAAHPSLVPETALLRIGTSSAASPTIEVPLSAQATDLGVSARPSPLDFGEQALGASALKAVQIDNQGARRQELTRVEVARADEPLAFTVIDGQALPRGVAAGAVDQVVVSFSPHRTDQFRNELLLWFRDIAEPLVVELRGTGVDQPCTGSCAGPQVVCPPDRSVFLQTTTQLVGWVFPADATDCAWSIGSSPSDVSAAVLRTDRCSASLLPKELGEWEVELRATDGLGREAACRVTVNVIPQPAFLVELAWSGEDDVDLHLFHPSAGPPNDPSWYAVPGDCFFSNSTPAWDAPGRQDDPVLEQDDRWGTGPERVRIAEPSRDHTYAVGVHWFDSTNGHAAQTVTTRIFCGGALAAERVVTLAAPHEASIVGTVRFVSPEACEVVPTDVRSVLAFP